MNIRFKLTLMAVVVGIVMIIMAMYGRYATDHVVELETAEIHVAEINIGMLKLRQQGQDLLTSRESIYRDQMQTSLKALDEKLGTLATELHASGAIQNQAEQLQRILQGYATRVLELADGRTSLAPDQANHLRNTFQQAESLHQQLAAAVNAHVKGQVDGLNRMFLIWMVVFIVFIQLGNIGLRRSIIPPVRRLHDVMLEATETGDLSLRCKIERKDEIGEMAESFDQMMDRINQSIREVASTSRLLENTSGDLFAAAQRTQASTDRNQKETDLVASAVNEMAASVQEVAHHANQAADVSQHADQNAREGREVVSVSVDAIQRLAGEIENASEVIQRLERDAETIGSVLDVIRGIAEQTNLLALNAAIEAARAGEQGRGFAVVADEVRTLASRTAESTEEIHTIISQLQSASRDAVQVMEQSRNQAHASVDHANRTGDALQKITQAIGRLSDMNTQIAAAAEEQSAVAEEIHRNVENIAMISQETNSGAQETAHSSESLAQEAKKLEQLVAQFRFS